LVCANHQEDLLDWSDGVKAFEAGNYRGAIEYFSVCFFYLWVVVLVVLILGTACRK